MDQSHKETTNPTMGRIKHVNWLRNELVEEIKKALGVQGFSFIKRRYVLFQLRKIKIGLQEFRGELTGAERRVIHQFNMERYCRFHPFNHKLL